jgi:hypothetical protein
MPDDEDDESSDVDDRPPKRYLKCHCSFLCILI